MVLLEEQAVDKLPITVMLDAIMRPRTTPIRYLSIVAVALCMAARADWPYAVMAAFSAWGGLSVLANLLALRRIVGERRTPLARGSPERTYLDTPISGALTSEETALGAQAQSGGRETSTSSDHLAPVERDVWANHDDALTRWDHQRLDTSNSVWK